MPSNLDNNWYNCPRTLCVLGAIYQLLSSFEGINSYLLFLGPRVLVTCWITTSANWSLRCFTKRLILAPSSQWRGGSKFSRGASVKFGAPKSNLDACPPPPRPPPKKEKNSGSVLIECRRQERLRKIRSPENS